MSNKVSYMTAAEIRKILADTDFVRTGGSEEELKAAEYLKECCLLFGAEKAEIETFPVQMAEIENASLTVNGKSIPCKGYFNCGSGEVTAPFAYLPNLDTCSLSDINGKVVLIDSGIGFAAFEDLKKNGAAAVITYNGNVSFKDRDIDQKELRSFVAKGEKLLAVNINVKDAVKLVKLDPEEVTVCVKQREYEGESRNVVAYLEGESDEFITLTAHYDSTSLSKGLYDNMTGCIGLLGILKEMSQFGPNHYSMRFIFCGSEERGLLGSKAYTADHENELENCVLNINLDMIGSIMGKFIACVSAEERLTHYIEYLSCELGWSISARTGVYSSDSTPFADHGVPAVSFARLAGPGCATIHDRYDTAEILSVEQIMGDIEFLVEFTERMANAYVCPVKRDMPDNVKSELDVYMGRKRK